MFKNIGSLPSGSHYLTGYSHKRYPFTEYFEYIVFIHLAFFKSFKPILTLHFMIKSAAPGCSVCHF